MDFGPLSILGQNIGQSLQDAQAQSVPGTDTDSSDLTNQIQQLFNQYKPQHQFTDMLMQHLGQYPTRQPPTKMQTLMASLASMSPHPSAVVGGQPVGFERNPIQELQAREGYLNEPFNQALMDWQNKLKPMEAGAQDERYMNTNMLNAINLEAARQIGANRAGSYKENVDSQVDYRGTMGEAALTRAQVAKQKLDLAKWTAEHNSFLQKDKKGNLWEIPKTGGPPVQVVDRDGAPIKATTEIEAIGARHNARLGEIEAGITGRLKEIEAVGQNQQRNIELRGKFGSAGMTSPQVKAEIANRTKLAGVTNPEWVKMGYITPTGEIDYQKVMKMDDLERAKFLETIFGYQPSDIDLDTNRQVNPPRPFNTPPKPKAGPVKDKDVKEVVVKIREKSSGRTGTTTEENAKKLDPNKYEIIK